MVSSHLKNPFFERFDRILINTIYTNFDNNAEQLFKRKLTPKSIKNRKRMEKSWVYIYRPSYELSQRNIQLLGAQPSYPQARKDVHHEHERFRRTIY